MTHMNETKFDSQGRYIGTQDVLRPDVINHRGRLIVPTSDETKWVGDWAEFKTAGGQVCFNEDQTEVTLRLPAPYKFGIGFYRQGEE